MDLLPWIADERRRVADLVDELTPQQLATPSLCDGWTVHDVTAHLLMPLVTPMWRMTLALAACRFDFDRANLRLTGQVARRSSTQIAAGLRAHATHPFKPPRMTHAAPLADLLIHQQDMCRPLGMSVEVVPERLLTCLDLVHASAGSGQLLPRGAADGLQFRAVDLDWACGAGQPVTGTGTTLLMALAGRRGVLGDVGGDGAAVFRARLAAGGAGPAR